MAKFERPKANQEVWPIMDSYKLACCDCGLVHNMEFHVAEVKKTNKDGSFIVEMKNRKKFRVMFKVTRNNRSTAQLRRHSK